MKHLIFIILLCLISFHFISNSSLANTFYQNTLSVSPDIDEQLESDLLSTFQLIKERKRNDSIHSLTLVIQGIDPTTPDLEYLLSRLKTTKYALIKRKFAMAQTVMKNTLIQLGIL